MILNCKWVNEGFTYAFLFFALDYSSSISEARPLVVGTTEHEALLAKEVGGDLIDVRWIVGADSDPQLADPGEGFLPILEKADLLLVNGQEIEAGWLGPLLKIVRNKKIMPGSDHYIPLSEGVTLLPYSEEELHNSKFQEMMLEMGMNHNVSNHHYWLDPENQIPMINNIKKALIKVDPLNTLPYESNAQGLIARLKEKIKEWDSKMIPFKGRKMIAYHRNWTYLAKRHGLEIVSYIEPKELTKPNEGNYKDLSNRFKQQNISIVLLSASERPPFVDVESVTDLAVKLHAHTIILPESMNPSEKRGDLISYFDYVYKVLTLFLQ